MIFAMALILSALMLSRSTFACSTQFTYHDLPEEVRLGDFRERPSVDQLIKIIPTWEQLGEQKVTDQEEQLFTLYTAIIKELLTRAKGRVIYIFARDGEGIFDALQTVLQAHPQGKNYRQFVRLINISRIIVANHAPHQLRAYMQSHGMDIHAILNGQQKVIWFDTGRRGTIFIKLMEAILYQIDFSRPQKEIKQTLRNLLTGIEGLLIVSTHEGTTEKILSLLEQQDWQHPSEVYQLLRMQLFFNEVLREQRAVLMLPEDSSERSRWVVDYIEHLPHYHGPALRLNDAGTQVDAYDRDELRRSQAAIRLQLGIIRHFLLDSVREDLFSVVEHWVNSLTQNNNQADGRQDLGHFDHEGAIK